MEKMLKDLGVAVFKVPTLEHADLAKILKDRLDKVGIEAPYDVIEFIGLSADRPGMVLVMGYEFLKWCKEKDLEVNVLAFMNYTNTEIGTETFDSYFGKLWDAQKGERGMNKIDTQEYWDVLKVNQENEKEVNNTKWYSSMMKFFKRSVQ